VIKIYQGALGYYWIFEDGHLVDGAHGPWPDADAARDAAERSDTTTDREDDPACVAYNPNPSEPRAGDFGEHVAMWWTG